MYTTKTNRLNTFPFLENKPTFFGTNVVEVEKYGIVFEFKTTQEYKLVAIDHFETLQMLYNQASDPDIQTILRKNYGYSTSGLKKRDSVAEKDVALSEWLCRQGYSGYAIHDMNCDLGKFHQEIVICNAKNIQLVKQITDNDKLQPYIDEEKMVNLKKSMKMEKSMKRRTRMNSSPKQMNFSPKQMNFSPKQRNFSPMDMSRTSIQLFESPPTTARKLFGGKKRTKRIRRKAKKN